MWGSSGNDIYVVGDYGSIYHFDGNLEGTWSEIRSGMEGNRWSIWGSSGSDIFALGGRTMLHYDGLTWSEIDTGLMYSWLNAVWGSSVTDVFAVGGNGGIFHYDGSTWNEMVSGTTKSLYGIWGSSVSDVFAVGDFGTILHYDGDADNDGFIDESDNCPSVDNPHQDDSYPPQHNNCGDACECEGNFNGDQDVDGTDAAIFKADFGRSPFQRPCSNADPCSGDFACDIDVDGSDAALFKQDFGRSTFLNPCPNCVTVPWCVYQ